MATFSDWAEVKVSVDAQPASVGSFHVRIGDTNAGHDSDEYLQVRTHVHVCSASSARFVLMAPPLGES